MNEKGNFMKKTYKNNNIQLSENQINQRIKNVNLTKRLICYERYLKAIPKIERRNDLKNSWHPETPRYNKQISLSQWNKELKKWRKQIHAWGNISEEDHRYICKLSYTDKYKYLCNLKMPELSNLEIKNMKKENEEISHDILKHILLIQNKHNNPFDENDKIMYQPIFFLPENFSGTVVHNEFVIIKEQNMEKYLTLLKDKYKDKYNYCFKKYYELYLLNKDSDNKNVENSKNTIPKNGKNHIVIYLGKETKPLNYKNKEAQYEQKEKMEAYNFLCGSTKKYENHNKMNKRKKF